MPNPKSLPSSPPASSPPKKRVCPPGEGDDEEIEACMICLDRRPNTMVLPCEHVVVCAECSPKLQSTRDARVCVRCRRPINAILQDGSEVLL